MLKKDVVTKIDFKTTKEKKEALKRIAEDRLVTVSYIMNELVDGFLKGQTYVAKRKEISFHLVKLIELSNFIESDDLRNAIQTEMEELQCLM